MADTQDRRRLNRPTKGKRRAINEILEPKNTKRLKSVRILLAENVKNVSTPDKQFETIVDQIDQK